MANNNPTIFNYVFSNESFKDENGYNISEETGYIIVGYCKHCGKHIDNPEPSFIINETLYCCDCAYELQLVTDYEYITNLYYSIFYDKNKIKDNLRVVKREGQILEHKFLCCNVDSKYLIVDISKKNHNDYRNNTTYQKWRLLVFERDNYTCQLCGQRGGNLNAHHIKPYKNFPELRLKLSNGLTLCEKCHKNLHKESRYKNDK